MDEDTLMMLGSEKSSLTESTQQNTIPIAKPISTHKQAPKAKRIEDNNNMIGETGPDNHNNAEVNNENPSKAQETDDLEGCDDLSESWDRKSDVASLDRNQESQKVPENIDNRYQKEAQIPQPNYDYTSYPPYYEPLRKKKYGKKPVIIVSVIITVIIIIAASILLYSNVERELRSGDWIEVDYDSTLVETIYGNTIKSWIFDIVATSTPNPTTDQFTIMILNIEGTDCGLLHSVDLCNQSGGRISRQQWDNPFDTEIEVREGYYFKVYLVVGTFSIAGYKMHLTDVSGHHIMLFGDKTIRD